MTTLHLTEEATKHVMHSSLNVKMFVNNSPQEAEKTISQWLKQNDVTIHHITQSQSEKGGNFVFVLTIFYRIND